jgi:hypothetical protein
MKSKASHFQNACFTAVCVVVFVFVVGGSSGLQDVTSGRVDREGTPGEGHSANPHFLSAFAKLQKASTSFVISVRPHGTRWLPLDGF